MMFELQATLIDQAPAQGPDLLELGFECSFELGIERSHRCNETRHHRDRSAKTCLDRHGTTLAYIYSSIVRSIAHSCGRCLSAV